MLIANFELIVASLVVRRSLSTLVWLIFNKLFILDMQFEADWRAECISIDCVVDAFSGVLGVGTTDDLRPIVLSFSCVVFTTAAPTHNEFE